MGTRACRDVRAARGYLGVRETFVSCRDVSPYLHGGSRRSRRLMPPRASSVNRSRLTVSRIALRCACAVVPPAPAPSLIARVSAVPLFASLSKEAIKQLCRAVQDNVTVAKGEALVQQGERCALYMLESGQLKLVCDEQEDAKTILKAPRSFGEPSLYADETLRVHEAAITAWAGEAKLLKFDAADIEALIGYGLP